MANKELTAKVRLDATAAEKSIDRLVKKINRIDNAVRKVGTNNKVEQQLTRSNSKLSTITSKVKTWANAQREVYSHTKATNNALSSVGGKLKRIAATYLGVMGAGAAIKTSDTMTASQNRLDYLASQNGGGANYTAEAMDKMYTSAQKVRMSYTAMMDNVTKSMTLAGSAFDGNIDNAIRFQEIMAEAYSIGGAKDAEKHSSMYQMIQALGSGVLQGDELRSVREGAPLAYKAIEEFAQGVYSTEESLKDLASQGKITADIVTAAILNSGKDMDKAFAQTAQRFDETWNQIKNAAQRAFLPVSNMLRDALNKAIDNGLIEKVESFFSVVSKGLQIIFKAISIGINWIADNWDWLKWIALGVIVAIIGKLLVWTTITVITSLVRIGCYIAENKWLLLIAATITALIWVFVQWKNAAIDTCTAIAYALGIVAIAAFIVGVIISAGWLLIVAAVLAALAVCAYFFEYVAGGAMWLKALITNIINFIFNLGVALGRSIAAICTNIGIAFENAWNAAKSAFWNFVADVLSGLKWLEPAINAIVQAFGGEGFSISGIASYATAKANSYQQKSYVDVGDAWSSGMSTKSYQNLNDAFNTGKEWGLGVKDTVNEWGSQFQTGFDGLSVNGMLDNMGEKLGLDLANSFPSASDPANALGNGAGSIPSKVGDIADNTGSMADAMDLTEEDLEYLRKLAAMEWKKEYTTANITVDMSNYNTINGETDLDGIVTRLADKVYEEMDYLANGVYA